MGAAARRPPRLDRGRLRPGERDAGARIAADLKAAGLPGASSKPGSAQRSMPTGCEAPDQAPRVAGTLRLARGRFESRAAASSRSNQADCVDRPRAVERGPLLASAPPPNRARRGYSDCHSTVALHHPPGQSPTPGVAGQFRDSGLVRALGLAPGSARASETSTGRVSREMRASVPRAGPHSDCHSTVALQPVASCAGTPKTGGMG